MRRIPLAFVLLGVLSLLVAGAVVLGVLQAPTGTDLTVHNDAGETLAANRVDGRFTATSLGSEIITFVFISPDRAVETARTAQGAVKEHRLLQGEQALGVLGPVKDLLSVSNFTQRDDHFVSTVPASTLFPASERALVSGTYTTTVTAAGGFVVEVHLSVSATEGGQHLFEQLDYRLDRVGSWERS